MAPVRLSVCLGEIRLTDGRAVDFAPWVEPLIARLIPILLNPKGPRSLHENAAVTIGRISLVHPDMVAAGSTPAGASGTAEDSDTAEVHPGAVDPNADRDLEAPPAGQDAADLQPLPERLAAALRNRFAPAPTHVDDRVVGQQFGTVDHD